MNLSRRNKYLAVIGFCGVALLIDRFALPRPASAEAALANLTVRPRTPAEAELKPVSSILPVPEIPFPKNIRTPSSEIVTKDFFANRGNPDARAHDSSRPHSTDAASSEIAAMAAEFETKHKLTGIMFDEHMKIAVLGDQWVELGHEVGGCFLKILEVDSATFACPGKDITLSLHKKP